MLSHKELVKQNFITHYQGELDSLGCQDVQKEEHKTHMRRAEATPTPKKLKKTSSNYKTCKKNLECLLWKKKFVINCE
jgi:hypothetical protein